jgi:hypothetical protein
MNQRQAAAIDLKVVRLEKNAEAGALAGQKKARKNG